MQCKRTPVWRGGGEEEGRGGVKEGEKGGQGDKKQVSGWEGLVGG